MNNQCTFCIHSDVCAYEEHYEDAVELYEKAKNECGKYPYFVCDIRCSRFCLAKTFSETPVEKVYLVNIETYYRSCGTTRCLGGIFDSLEKAKKYCSDLKEKIEETNLKLAKELECYIDEVNLNRGHSMSILSYDNDDDGHYKEYAKNIDFEDVPIVLGGYVE